MRDPVQVKQDYERALDELVEHLESDPTVVAAVLWGSLAYDEVWERSDIDITIVRDDRKARAGSGTAALTYGGVNIHANVTTRAEFKRQLQSTSWWTTEMTRGRLLFTRDESLRRIFDEVSEIGDRDRRNRLLGIASGVVTITDKAEKWLRVKRDAHYATVWLCAALQSLASIEAIRHKQAPKREAIEQAMELSPEVFGPMYTGLLDGPKTVEAVDAVLQLVYAYLDEHREELFGPLLDYLEDEATLRSVTDIQHHFGRRVETRMVVAGCEWLAERGVLVKMSAPYYLNEHSKRPLEELAFLLPDNARQRPK